MRWLRTGLAPKLFVSYLLVVLVGVATLFIAVTLLAPNFFQLSMSAMMGGSGMNGMMGGPSTPSQLTNAQLDVAFQSALRRALLIATALAALAAFLASLFVARQIVRPIQRMVRATHRIESGHYAERVAIPPANAGDELGQLATSFNEMAGSLEQTERRRLDLVGDVAHELRTPIATLEGYLEGLLDGVIMPSEEMWAKLHGEAGRLRRLVDDLQELSRAEARQIALSIRPVAPTPIAQAALDRLRPQFEEKGLELRVTIPADLPPVLADQDRAVQVLSNLLTNALRYTPAPGRVEVSIQRAGDAVAFRVADTGAGIAPEHLEHLFERFYRVDKSRSRALGGSGIGLTIAKALTEAMGGQISAASPGVGQGSTFTFTLPISHHAAILANPRAGLTES
jgi:signal transduction histidine kinase